MKTSLIIEDSLFEAAKKEAGRQNKNISEMIVMWARAGYKHLSHESKKTNRKKKLAPLDLGGPAKLDLTSRRDWMDLTE